MIFSYARRRFTVNVVLHARVGVEDGRYSYKLLFLSEQYQERQETTCAGRNKNGDTAVKREKPAITTLQPFSLLIETCP